MQKIEYYTTHQLALLANYKSRRTLLQALHNNQKKRAEVKDDKRKYQKWSNNFLSKLWNCRSKSGKVWGFEKVQANNVLREYNFIK